MILFIHLLFGAAVGSAVKNIPLAVVLAFLSHYFLDFLPHIEYDIANIREKQWQKKLAVILKVILDFCLGILLILIFSNNQPILYLYAIIAMLPDALTIVNNFLSNKILEAHYAFHTKKIHFLKYKKISVFWRISSQIAAIIISIILLKI